MLVRLEVCVDSVESALAAVEGGADRLELCGNLGVGGGTTPSLGLFKRIQRALPEPIPVMVMIRPRTGDFLYSEEEVEVMHEDINIFKRERVHGFVFGVLKPDGDVDLQRMRRLVKEVSPLEVCFHRAFDMTRDVEKSLRDISSISGITRILTSGQRISAPSSLETLERMLLQVALSSITIMPGSGINPETVGAVISALIPVGLTEIHMSGGRWLDGEMRFRREGMGMGTGASGDWGVFRTDAQRVRQVKQILLDGVRR